MWGCLPMQIAFPRRGLGLLPSFGTAIAIGLSGLVLVAGVYLVYQRLSPAQPAPAQSTAKVTRGTLTASVNATGSAVSPSTSRLTFKASGRVTEVPVGVGDAVEEGQVLARLDSTDLELTLQQARTALVAAQAKLEQVLAGSRPEEIDAARAALAGARARFAGMQEARPEEVAAAEAVLAAAQAKLAAMLAGGRPEEVESAEAAVSSALARLQQLRAGPDSADLAAAQAGLDSARASLQSSRIKLEEVVKGPTAADLAAAEGAVGTARSNLEAAQAKLQALQEPATQAEISAAQADVSTAQAGLQSAIAKRDADRQAGAPSEQLRADEAAITAAQARVNAAQAKLRDLRAPDAEDVQAARAAVEAATANLSASTAKLEQLRAGALPADLAAARAAVESGEANVRAAEAKLSSLLAGPKDADLAAAEASLIQAETSLALRLFPSQADILAQEQAVKQAETSLALKLSPSTEFDLEAQRQAVRQAEAQLALKQAPPLPADVIAANAAVQQAEASLAVAVNNLNGAQIIAPFGGMVSAVNMSLGESTAGVTAQTGAGSAGITLVDPSRVRVDVQVDESDIAQIATGQRASVTFDALPNRRFSGVVGGIAPAGSTTQGVVGYLVSIVLRNAQDVRPGMTAVAEIVHTERENILMVPNRAIIRQGRERSVQVVTAQGTEPRRVEVGVANDQMTEITAGLVEGEEVAIPTTAARASVPGARPPGGTFVAPVGGPRPGGR